MQQQPPVTGTEFIFKVPVVGSHGTGKTTLVLQMTSCAAAAVAGLSDAAPLNPKTVITPTIGLDFYAVYLANVKPDMHARIQFWDTAGSEQFGTVAPVAIRNAAAVIVVFDVTKVSTLDDVRDRWLPLVIREYGVPPQKVFLVGNKTDRLGEATEAVDADMVEAINAQYDSGLCVLDCSAVTGTNVAAVLGVMADVLLEPYENMPMTASEVGPRGGAAVAVPPPPPAATKPPAPAPAAQQSTPAARAAVAAAPPPTAIIKQEMTGDEMSPRDDDTATFSDPDDSSKEENKRKKKPTAVAVVPPAATASAAREPRPNGSRAVVVNMPPASPEEDSDYESSEPDSSDSSISRIRKEKKDRAKQREKAKAARHRARDGGGAEKKSGCPC